ncbi:pseudaminic acid synthase [Tolumonas lignilytica]|uniref:pseudaminic acid synthase n=1 Tax=Tolumonas lignilytica TaxID=1283284 RepID=UPI001929DCA0|nr:pseudaminic acid synthase [Tolumonas lignilytica]
MNINGRLIGEGQKPYIIAELSGNHNGDLNRALALVDAAAAAGADAIKLQTYTADTMTLNCDSDDFKIKGGLWDGYSLYQLYQTAHTPWEWHQPLFERANSLGITIFSTPFDETAVDFLEKLHSPAYKVASFEMTDLPLLRYIAKTGKPVIISTGLASLDEIKLSIDTLKTSGCEQILLMHCISGYPTPIEQANLKTIPDLAKKFNVTVGLSDHTLGTLVSTVSIALGAVAIEKHFTLARSDGGPDASFSIEPTELKQLCNDCNSAWQSLGFANYSLKDAEKDNLRFRRSIYVVKDIKAGESLTPDNIRRIRPGFGLSPSEYENVLGKKASCDIKAGTSLNWSLIV